MCLAKGCLQQVSGSSPAWQFAAHTVRAGAVRLQLCRKPSREKEKSMLSSSWLRNSKRSALAPRQRTQTSPRQRTSARLELLEDRCLFSTLTVTSLQDTGAGSLRATITAAASGDTIVFSSSLFSSATAPSSPLVSSALKVSGSGKGNGSGKGHGKPVSPPPPPTTPNTITLTSGPLALAKNLTIQGPTTTPLTITSTAIYASSIFGVGLN